MEEFKRAAATMLLIAVTCSGCTDGLDANGVPRDGVPAGYTSNECLFEEMEQRVSSAEPSVNRTNAPRDETRWQRLVCHHG